MNDYFDHIERQLIAAMRSGADLPWYSRLRLRRRPVVSVVLAMVVLAAPAAALVRLLEGSQVPSNIQFGPGNGYALPSGTEIAVSAADPHGGLRWALRLTHTSQQEVCLQLGRLAFGAVGELGINGAFHNDGRFHPYSANFVNGPPYCAIPDSAGNAFVNIQEWHVSVSGLSDYGGCQKERPCRSGNVNGFRNVYYGLLGPDAVSVSYRTASGAIATIKTVGPDGAYLLVAADRSPTYDVTAALDVDLDLLHAPYPPQPIVAVTYRDSQSCRLDAANPACAPVRAVPPTPPSAAQVAAPVSARIAADGSILVSFTARVAATNSHYYYASLTTSRCGSGSFPAGALTRGSPIGPQPFTPAGTRVHANLGNPGCSGRIHGRVVLVTDGPDLILDSIPGHGTHIFRTVGTFTLER